MKQKQTHVSHDNIPIFIDNEATVLLLGSLPSVKSREYGFYYAHPRFKVLSTIFNEQEPLSVEDRKEFLIRHHIALYDVIEECDIHGSSDSSIKNAKVIDIKGILNRYPNIKKIGVNGSKAKVLFDKYLLDIVKQFDIKVFYLPSTSPANSRMGVDELADRYTLLFN